MSAAAASIARATRASKSGAMVGTEATILAIVFAFLIITFLHVVIGELVPKGVALQYSERVALAVSAPVRGFFILAGPLIWILQKSTELILRAMRMEPRSITPT